MAMLPLQIERDHIARLARMHDPVGAVEELIWNALDAEADRVDVVLDTNALGGVERVSVSDDGTGMAADDCADYFQPIGSSWKRRAGVSPVKKRALHGKNGQGRLRAFALGKEVRWTSVTEAPDGCWQVVIESGRGCMHEFYASDPEPTLGEGTGTVFEALGGDGLAKLTESTARTTLTAAFAPHLEAYPDIAIFYDGVRLDPAQLQSHVAMYRLAVPGGTDEEELAEEYAPLLKVIEWNRPVTRALILCDEKGMSLEQRRPDIQAPGFHFTAYLYWRGFTDASSIDLTFADWLSDDLPWQSVIDQARHQLRQHFRNRAEERRQEIVDEWRTQGIYPYSGEPSEDRERAERETFDTVATTIVRHLPNMKSTRRTTLRFLRSALAHDPQEALHLVDEIFALTRQEREELTRLLDRTPLSSLIKASTAVTDRLDFLAALEHLVFDPVAKGRVKERTELHRILERECWVFGEEYGLYVSDRSLTEVLRRHTELLGRPQPAAGVPVLRPDGSRGVVDLMLSRSGPLRNGERHHLVVELKRPKLTLGMAEFEQLSSYAQAVMADDRFRDNRVTWDFWLVGNDMSPSLLSMAHQKDRAPGCAIDQGNYRLWVRTWGELVEDCSARLQFYRDELEYQSSNEHAMDYLIREHADTVSGLVADGVVVPGQQGGTPAGAVP